MRKLFVMSCLFCLTLTVTADDVTKINASKVKQITFNGDQVTVKYNDGTPDATLDMGTVVLDFGSTTSIEERTTLVKKAGLQGKKVYDLKGREVVNGERLLVQGSLKSGVYIIDGKKVTIK